MRSNASDLPLTRAQALSQTPILLTIANQCSASQPSPHRRPVSGGLSPAGAHPCPSSPMAPSPASLPRSVPTTPRTRHHRSSLLSLNSDHRLSTIVAALSCSRVIDEATGGRASALFHFESSKEIHVQHNSHATAVLETETEFSKDAQAIREQVLK